MEGPKVIVSQQGESFVLQAPPDDFLDSVTYVIMTDPVCLPRCGHSFDRETLIRISQTNRCPTCPTCRADFGSQVWINNVALKRMIQQHESVGKLVSKYLDKERQVLQLTDRASAAESTVNDLTRQYAQSKEEALLAIQRADSAELMVKELRNLNTKLQDEKHQASGLISQLEKEIQRLQELSKLHLEASEKNDQERDRLKGLLEQSELENLRISEEHSAELERFKAKRKAKRKAIKLALLDTDDSSDDDYDEPVTNWFSEETTENVTKQSQPQPQPQSQQPQPQPQPEQSEQHQQQPQAKLTLAGYHELQEIWEKVRLQGVQEEPQSQPQSQQQRQRHTPNPPSVHNDRVKEAERFTKMLNESLKGFAVLPRTGVCPPDQLNFPPLTQGQHSQVLCELLQDY